MLHKVFLVEDEIVIREGIRDSVNWAAASCAFCGEAPDGEVALPLIQATQPDIVITDIKMPFVDGLELCRVLKDIAPATKIIILSGHDEFSYAQAAIQAGVTQYLLKPVNAQELLDVLRRVGQQIEHEKQANEKLQRLQDQVQDNLQRLRENVLVDLVTGHASTPHVLDMCRQWQIDIVARWYLVMVVRTEALEHGMEPATRSVQQLDHVLKQLVGRRSDCVMFKKELVETVLILKGNDADTLRRERDALAQQIAAQPHCTPVIGVGEPVDRIGAIAQSFEQALQHARTAVQPTHSNTDQPPPSALFKLDPAAITNFLKYGISADFEDFFATFIQPLLVTDSRSLPRLQFVLTAIVLPTANFIRELGAAPEQVVPELYDFDAWTTNIRTIADVRERARHVLLSALQFRDHQAHHQRAVIAKARDYIDRHFFEADMSLNTVAAQVSLSSSYFSVVFSREVGETFIEYVTRVRIQKAMELLRTTALTCSEIAHQVGYNNPRYFFSVFKKAAGQSPIEFRQQADIRARP